MQSAQTTLSIGTIIKERYIVEDLLGMGGFGAVYLVRDQRVLGNLFALKEVSDPNMEDQKRFAFEGEVLKRLDHPALPRVYRIFDEDNNRIYMLMDYIEGPNLEQLRQSQPNKQIPLSQVIDIMTPIVNAVSYLHQQDPPIIHRDIKPANIIVPDEHDKSVLVDFGIAKEYDQEGTTTAIRRCSPGYGAPEQYARGTNVQTDVYGLAATCYALLTGTIPADALYRMTQIGSKHTDPLEPINELAPNIPPHVANAIQRAMAISMNERFPSVDAFWQALQAMPLIETAPSYEDVPSDDLLYASTAKRPRVLAPSSSSSTGNISAEHSPVSLTPVVSVVPAIAAPGIQEPFIAPQREIQHERRERRRWPIVLIFFACIALLVLLAGLLFETGILPGIHTSTTGTPPVKKTSVAVAPTSTPYPTATPTHVPTATPSPTTVPTTVPTATPTTAPVATPIPTTAPSPGVQLHSSYSGTITDAIGPTNSTMQLTSVTENGSSIRGNFVVYSPLQGSNPFSGSLSSNIINFTVQPYAGHLPLAFTGTVASNGSISGTYCAVDANGCNYSQGHGTWQVS